MKKTYLMLLIGIFIFTSVVIFNGCSKKEDVIKLGGLFSTTGNVAAYGERSKKGFELAVDLINQSGGIHGKQIVTYIEDAKSQAKDGLTAYNKLKNIDDVDIIVGDILSSTTMAIVPNLEKDKVLLFAPGASNPSLKGASPLFFRNWTSDDFDGYAMAHYIYESNHREVGLIVQQADYPIGLANAFIKEFESLGGAIITQEKFQTDDTNFKSQIIKLKNSNIKVMYLIGESKENGNVLKQSYELNFKPIWFANLTVDTPECRDIAGIASDGVIFSTPAFDLNSNKKEVSIFIEEFKDRYNEEPEATSGHAYDAVNILAKAIAKVGTNPIEIAEELKTIKNFPGVTGVTTIDEDGDVVKDVYIKKIEGDKVLLLKDYIFN